MKNSNYCSERKSREQIITGIANETNLAKVDVERVFDALLKVIFSHLHPRGSGEIIIPKIGIKLKVVRRNPTPTRMINSPFSKTLVKIDEKPERKVVKVVLLKPIKKINNALSEGEVAFETDES